MKKQDKIQSPPSLLSLKKDAQEVVKEISKINTPVPMLREIKLLKKKLIRRGILKSKAEKMAQTLLGNIKSSETARNFKAFEGMFDQEAVNRAVKQMEKK